MRNRVAVALLYATLVSSGCSDRPAAPPAGAFDRQLQAIDKAKGVEQTMQDQAEERRRTMDAAEGR